MEIEPFAGPKYRTIRAAQHMGELIRILNDFCSTSEFRYVEAGDGLWKFESSKELPITAAMAFADCVHNFRAALDICICDAARLRGKSLNSLQYPFKQGAAAFRDFLKSPRKTEPVLALGDDILAVIKSSRPYSGGNFVLSTLHELDRRGKHRFMIPVTSRSISKFNLGRLLEGTMAERGLPVIPVEVVSASGLPTASIQLGEVFDLPEGVHPDEIYPIAGAELDFRVLAREPRDYVSVVSFLESAGGEVSKVIDGFCEVFGIGRAVPERPPLGDYTDLRAY